jgi:hypothetical protein
MNQDEWDVYRKTPGVRLVMRIARMLNKSGWRADFAYGDTAHKDGECLAWTSPDKSQRILLLFKAEDKTIK